MATTLTPLPPDLEEWRDWLAAPMDAVHRSWEEVNHGCDDIFATYCADYILYSDPEDLGSGARVILHFCEGPEHENIPLIAIPELSDFPRDDEEEEVVFSKLNPVAGQCTEAWLWRVDSGGLEGCIVQHPIFHWEPGPTEDLGLPVLAIEGLIRKYTLRHDPVVLSLVQLPDGLYVLKTPRRDKGFAQDALTMASLPPSDFCIRPAFSVVDRNRCWRGILMPYEVNGSLLDIIRKNWRGDYGPQSQLITVPWRLKLVWAKDVVAALSWLHGYQSAWGDLKPDNIVVCRDGHCRLIDYAGPTFRTHADWAAPEFQFFQPRSTAEDVFALGLLFWMLATEQPSIPRHDGVLHLHWPKEIDPAYEALVKRCTDDDPANRPTLSEINTVLCNI